LHISDTLFLMYF